MRRKFLLLLFFFPLLAARPADDVEVTLSAGLYWYPWSDRYDHHDRRWNYRVMPGVYWEDSPFARSRFSDWDYGFGGPFGWGWYYEPAMMLYSRSLSYNMRDWKLAPAPMYDAVSEDGVNRGGLFSVPSYVAQLYWPTNLPHATPATSPE